VIYGDIIKEQMHLQTTMARTNHLKLSMLAQRVNK